MNESWSTRASGQHNIMIDFIVGASAAGASTLAAGSLEPTFRPSATEAAHHAAEAHQAAQRAETDAYNAYLKATADMSEGNPEVTAKHKEYMEATTHTHTTQAIVRHLEYQHYEYMGSAAAIGLIGGVALAAAGQKLVRRLRR